MEGYDYAQQSWGITYLLQCSIKAISAHQIKWIRKVDEYNNDWPLLLSTVPCSCSKANVVTTAQSEIKLRLCVFSLTWSQLMSGRPVVLWCLGMTRTLLTARSDPCTVWSMIAIYVLEALLRFMQLIMPTSRCCHWCDLGCLHKTSWRSSHRRTCYARTIRSSSNTTAAFFVLIHLASADHS